MNKNTLRRLSILLCLAMVLAMLPLAVFAATPKTLYVDLNDEWYGNSKRVAAYFYCSYSNGWADAVLVDEANGIYAVDIPGGYFEGDGVIFCSMNPGTTDNNWSNKWNQTADLTIPGDGTNYIVLDSGWTGISGTWTTYTPAEPEPEESQPAESQPEESESTEESEPVMDTTASLNYQVTVYCVDTLGWGNVNAYAWGTAGSNAAWPGVAMTDAGFQVQGCNVYEVEVLSDCTGIIFNNGSSQTSDLTVNDGQYFDLATNQWYEFSDEIPAPEVKSATVYCINSAKWAAVAAYAWSDGAGSNAAWPGVLMTKTEETVNGFDIYEITLSASFANLIFNNNNNGAQTFDLTVNDGQYFDIATATWYASLSEVPAVDPLATGTYLAGSFNGWNTTENEFRLNAEGDSVGYLSLELAANTSYEFKIVNNGIWLGYTGTITEDATGLVFNSEYNAVITTNAAGTYVFAYDAAANTLSITYPEAPVVENPTAVEGLVPYSATRTSFTVDWNDTPNAVKYWVYVDGRIYCSTTESQATVTKRKVDTEYTVSVTALLEDGTILSLEEAPTTTVRTNSYGFNSSYEAQVDSIRFTWNVADCTKTWIYFGTDPTNLKLTASSTTGEYTVKKLEDGVTYYYELSHLIDGKIVRTSEVAEVTTPVNEALTATMEVVDGVATFSWNAVGDSYKYWVIIETAEKKIVRSTTELTYTMSGVDFENSKITVRGINSECIYDYKLR